MGGSKGQSSQQTNQSQTYSPNPQAMGYLQGALQQGQQAAQTPFQAQVAPVAGFSQDQQSAFGAIRGAQGMAQPYYNQAQSYFNQSATPDVSQFFNPYASAVMGNMQDLFGQQQAQNTGSLTKAAGGVGADRIAVGQQELNKQQGQVAGQTMSQLYAPALQAAQQQQQTLQNAGYGVATLGQQAQNSVFQGAQQQLGTGGLQQQLSQAQMNAPYQWDMARLAYPFQTAQFNAGITGALAPGMGGTTQGTGNTQNTPAQPSIWSQLLGAGVAGAGIYGATGGFGGAGGNEAYGGTGTMGSGNGVYGGSSSNPLPGLSASDYGQGFARGGDVNPYASGGEVSDDIGGVSTRPIDINAHSIVPQEQLSPIKANMPQLNLNPPPSQQSSGSGGLFGTGVSAGDVAKMAMMFANRGGRIDPYAQGGPVGYADAGAVNDEPYRMPDRPDGVDPMDAWRSGVAADMGTGRTATPVESPLPPEITGHPAPSGGTAMAYAGPDSAPPLKRATSGAQGENPFAQDPEPPQSGVSDFQKSPWAALTSAGLGMMAGTSPFAGVNIGQGGLQGMKTLETQREAAQKDTTIAQSAKRLAQEAKFHEDQYTRMTPYQQKSLAQTKELAEAEAYAPAGSIMTKDGLHPAFYDKKTAQVLDGITGKPPEATDHVIPKGASRNSPEEIANVVESIKNGNSPPTLTGLYGDSVHVRSGLEAAGVNLAKLQVEWDRAKKATAAVNSSRMTAYVGLNKSVDSTIDEVRRLSQDMQLGGIPLMNKIELAKYIQTQGNSEQGQLATKYMTAVNTLKEEFANLANGGYAPTEAAWKLANEQVNGNFGVKQLGASIDEIQRLIRYRLQAVPNLETLGPGAPNRYTNPAGTPPPASGGAHGAPAAGAPDPKGPAAGKARFGELLKTMTPEQAYEVLNDEGYHQ